MPNGRMPNSYTAATSNNDKERVDRVIKASRSLIADAIHLFVLELKEMAIGAVKLGLLGILGLVFIIIGWLALVVGFVFLLKIWLPIWGALLCISGFHLIFGTVAFLWGIKQPHAPKLKISQEETAAADQHLKVEEKQQTDLSV